MSITPFTILVVIGLLLAILSMVRPGWPLLLGVAVVLLAVALLIKGG